MMKTGNLKIVKGGGGQVDLRLLASCKELRD